MSETQPIYTLEVPPEDTIDIGRLTVSALDFVTAIPTAETGWNREPVTGILFRDAGGFAEVGIDIQSTEEGYLLQLHLPHVDALAPANSPFDDLMRYVYVYNNAVGRNAADKIFRSLFSGDGSSAWPSLTISVPLELDGGFLKTRWPTIKATTYHPSYVVTGSLKKRLDRYEETVPASLYDCLTVSQQLAKQRFQSGAFEIYHENEQQRGRLWVRDPDTSKEALVPLSNASLIKRELLLAGALSIGDWLRVRKASGLYLADSQRPTLDAPQISFLVNGYFNGNISASVLLNTLIEAGGMQHIEASHKANSNAYGSLVAPIGAGRRAYGDLVNTRVAEYVDTIGESLYKADEISAFAVIARVVARNGRNERSDREVKAGHIGIGWVMSREGALHRRSAEELAGLSRRSFRLAYDSAKKGRVAPEKFLAGCLQRITTRGSIPGFIVLENLFPPDPSEMAELLQEPMLLYVANNPVQATVIIAGAEATGDLHEVRKRPAGSNRVVVLLKQGEREVVGAGENEHVARANALIKLATNGQRDIDYYRQHPDAEQWTIDVERFAHMSAENPVYVLNQLSKGVDTPQTADYKVLRKVDGQVTMRATATLAGRLYESIGTARTPQEAERLAAEEVLRKYRRHHGTADD